MLGLEMQTTKATKLATTSLELVRPARAGEPSRIEQTFACQLAISVWLNTLSDRAAKEALSAYVKAGCRNRLQRAALLDALEREYHLCRERLDLCS